MSQYNKVIEMMKSGQIYQAVTGHRFTLVRDPNNKWRLCTVTTSELNGRPAGTLFSEFPLELGQFIDLVDADQSLK